MHIEAVLVNAILAAQRFNPSVFSQLWLAKKDIVGEDDFKGGAIFTNDIVQVSSTKLKLLVLPPQLQLIPLVPTNEQAGLIKDKLGSMVEALPETPYVGAGLNFVWHCWSDDEKTGALSKRLFYRAEKPIFKHFGESNAFFGSYLSQDAIGCRLKLDVKPVTLGAKPEEVNKLQFAFNFHMVPGEADIVGEIQKHLARWDDAQKLAASIMEEIKDV